MSPPPVAASARLLVVEDDRGYQRSPAVWWRHLGHDVWSADDGDGASNTWERERGEFDLVLNCGEMVGMSGHELRDELTRRRPEVRVLSPTTRDDDRLGALPQPNSVDAAIETLAAALSGRAGEHDLGETVSEGAAPGAAGGP